jgi:peptidoglycan/LPS O-acetylase OafA/YrhL
MKGRAPTLDALRGLAVLAVLLFHAGAFPVGWLGVPVFFTLSGYFITRQLAGGVGVGAFWARRATRIIPLLFAYLAINLAMNLAQGRGMAGYGWHFLFLSDQLIARDMVGTHGHVWHLWSIAVEMQAYALWPAVAKRRGLLWALAPVGIGYWLLAGAPMTLVGSIGFFAAGGLLAKYEAPQWPTPRWLAGIGRAGYSIYVWQMMCIALVVRAGVPWLGVPASLAVGIASYWLIERHASWTVPVRVALPLVLSRLAIVRRRKPPLSDAVTVLTVESPSTT